MSAPQPTWQAPLDAALDQTSDQTVQLVFVFDAEFAEQHPAHETGGYVKFKGSAQDLLTALVLLVESSEERGIPGLKSMLIQALKESPQPGGAH